MKRYFLITILFASGFTAKTQDNTLQAGGDFLFFPGNDISLPPGATDSLWIKEMIKDVPADPSTISSVQWTIDGKDYSNQNSEEGNLKFSTLQFYKAVYKAPLKVPPHNPIVITASFQPEGQKEKIILYCRIHVIDKENYFYLNSRNTAGGILYELKESPIPSFRKSRETANYVNDQWNIGANGFQKTGDDNNSTQFMGIGVSFVGNRNGTYKWTVNGNDKTGLKPPCNTVTVSGSGKDGSPFQYMSADCVPHGDDNCKLTALQGNTTISIFDRKNKIIKGYFSGILMSATHDYVSVSGAFSVYIN
jgi:hypothetical protein